MPKFKTKLGDGFIELPFDVREEFGKARPPIRITINGYTYRSTVSVYGDKYFVPVRKSNQDAAGIKEGDSVAVTILADTDARTVKPPAPLAAALKKNPKAKAAWESLSFTNKKECADAIVQAKKEETRDRRLEKILKQLTEKSTKN